jgi:hypothetical protein
MQDNDQTPSDRQTTIRQNAPPNHILTQHDQNHPIGARIATLKEQHTIRLYFQNINGISKNNWHDWKDAAAQIANLHIDVFGCAETNIAWTEPKRKYAQQMIPARKWEQVTINQAALATA